MTSSNGVVMCANPLCLFIGVAVYFQILSSVLSCKKKNAEISAMYAYACLLKKD